MIAPGSITSTTTAPAQLSTGGMTVFGSYAAIRTLQTMKPTFNESYLLLSRRFEGRVKPKEDGQVFRVMQWNVLAQGLRLIGIFKIQLVVFAIFRLHCALQLAYLMRMVK